MAEDLTETDSIRDRLVDKAEYIRVLEARVEELEREVSSRTWRAEAAEEEARLNRAAAEKHYAYGERCLAIAKEAEDESQEAEERHKVECAELRQRVEELEGERASVPHLGLKIRCEAAEAEVDIANRKLVECGEVWDAQEAKIAETEAALRQASKMHGTALAKVERLREALGEIARKECEPSCAVDRGPGLQTEWCNPCIARKALAPEVKP